MNHQSLDTIARGVLIIFMTTIALACVLLSYQEYQEFTQKKDAIKQLKQERKQRAAYWRWLHSL